MKERTDYSLLLIPAGLLILFLYQWYLSQIRFHQIILLLIISAVILSAFGFLIYNSLPNVKEYKKRLEKILEIPATLLVNSNAKILLGQESNLEIPIYLPDSVRNRHIHILGATGSGKTESVIFNFLRQDCSRGFGAIILDAKGDQSFLTQLKSLVPSHKLQVFDLSSEDSLGYNPLRLGSSVEAAQRLFSSLTWSEEYYKSKAFSALQSIFDFHHRKYKKNPTLIEISNYLSSAEKLSGLIENENQTKSQALSEFQDLSGLRDQIRSLTLAHLGKILSPSEDQLQIDFKECQEGVVVYFRLQSLLSPQIVATIGKMIINELNYMAGISHREGSKSHFLPVYFDEFASFACLEFADLISKARSAGFALHFSHQSIGDVAEVSPSFMNRIADNSATKIVLRINDPDTAEYFARSFGTKIYQKTTQRITNTKNIDSAEIVGEGTSRDAHQFRASPDLLKTLPTGVGAVLVSHGEDGAQGASNVFTIRFPKLESVVRAESPLVSGV